MVWVKKSSIRPVPSYAKIHGPVLEKIRNELFVEDDTAEERLNTAFAQFEASQPIVAARIGDILERPFGEATIALGFFLSLAIWMAFERAHGSSLDQVTTTGFDSTIELVDLDESFRKEEENESLETDDVIAMEQPALVHFIHEQMAATLELSGAEVNPAELAAIYRIVLIEVLALSYAVKTPVGFPNGRSEALA